MGSMDAVWDERQGPAGRLLEADGLICRVDQELRTTRRWQGAMARAAKKLAESEERLEDLRVPIVHALIETYGAELPDDTIVAMVAVLAPIEAAELNPQRRSG